MYFYFNVVDGLFFHKSSEHFNGVDGILSFIIARVANLLGFSFIAINNKMRPIYCNKPNKIQ